MYRIGLFDGSFTHQKSMTLGGENKDISSNLVQWSRSEQLPVCVFTDMLLSKVHNVPDYITRIALLLEPPSLSDTHYKTIMKLRGSYDCILTFMRDLTETENDFMYYPLGGSWISLENCRIGNKTKNVSIIASSKTGAVGHRLRHSIIGKNFTVLDGIFGTGYKKIESKVTALADYRYSIVVESCQVRGYFSEKIVDCISMGTIPIYWGCPDIGDYFDRRGILTFNSMEELDYILNEVTSAQDYDARLPFIQKNHDISWRYRCAEDWIASNYSFLFEQCEI